MADPNLQYYAPAQNLPELADSAYVDADAPPPGARIYEEYRQEKRQNVQLIQLTSGNLVVDVPVPDRVLQNAVYKDSEEFTHMRYTVPIHLPP
jgi:chitin synthase